MERDKQKKPTDCQLDFLMTTKNKSNKNACPMQSGSRLQRFESAGCEATASEASVGGTNKKSQLISVGLFVGTSKRTRTADFAVRGRRLNRLTIEAC